MGIRSWLFMRGAVVREWGGRCCPRELEGVGRVVVQERGAVVCGWQDRCCLCELEGVGRGGCSLGTVVRGSRVVGWVFGHSPWDLDFVLAMEREREHSPKE
jgi:hypothetical protein